MYKDKLQRILNKHEKWLASDGKNGECADLRGYDLQGADLKGVNLREVILRGGDLQKVNLTGANLENAILIKANLRGAILQDTNLRGAFLQDTDLRGAVLISADLRGAKMQGALLQGADLQGAILRNANLQGACLDHIRVDNYTAFYHICCPTEGSFIGFKKCRGGKIVKLLIPADAKRCSATSSKCRCDKAKVLSIEDKKGNIVDQAISIYDDNFIYRTGAVVTAQDFDDDRWKECGRGIHFFLTKDEAMCYWC